MWKATSKFKRPLFRVPPLKDEAGGWVRKDKDKAELFARHLTRVFQPHNIQTRIEPAISYKGNAELKHVSPQEIAQIIDKEIKLNKAPGMNEISPKILKELSRKGVVLLTYIYNACFRLEYVPNCFKSAQIIMLKKPDKPDEDITSSYRPISLLPVMSKLFEKILSKRLKPIITIPNHQFGFCNQHSTIEQVHRITSIIEKAFEEKNYCSAVFLDVAGL